MAKPTPRAEAPSLPQPHDTLFKWTFSHREHAAGLLRAALPPALVGEIDFRTLRLEKGSYINRALRSRHSDLVYSVRMRGTKLYVYVLVEQQRDVEALMIVRMGIYMMRLWEEILREHPDLKRIPPLFPILVHHSETGWTAATAFQDVVAMDDAVRSALLPYTPCFQMRLVDLTKEKAEILVNEVLTALGQMVLWALSVAGDDERLKQEVGRTSAALSEVLGAPDAHAALEVLLRYLLATHRSLSAEEVRKMLEEAGGPGAGEVIRTALDDIELRGRAQMLLDLLTARFGTVPARVSARIRAADEATLTRWGVRMLSASSLKDVLDDESAKERSPRKSAGRRRSARS